MRYITQRALLFPKDKPRLSFWDETWLITTDVKPERTQQAFAQAVSEHAEFCKSSAGVTKFPLGRIVHFPCSDHPEDFVYTKLITWISPPSHPALLEGRLACKPRGNYAVILHRGGTSTVARSYAKLLDYVKEEGLDLVGPVYEFDMNSYLMSDSADDYLVYCFRHFSRSGRALYLPFQIWDKGRVEGGGRRTTSWDLALDDRIAPPTRSVTWIRQDGRSGLDI